MSDVKIVDSGSVNSLEFDLRPGTVTELIGRNGSGKSTAAKMVAFALAPESEKVPLGVTVRDGAKKGYASIGGVVIRVGARSCSRTGESETFVLLDDGDQIGTLIEPGIAKPSSRNLERIRSLVTMAGVSIPSAEISKFAGSSMTLDEVKKLEKLPAVDQVERVKSSLEEHARLHEKTADRIQGQIVEIGDIPENACQVSSDVALRCLTDATNALTTAQSVRKSAESAAAALVGFTRPDVAGVRALLADAEDNLIKVEAEIAQLKLRADGLKKDIEHNRAAYSQSVKTEADLQKLQSAVACTIDDAKIESLEGAVKVAEDRYQLAKKDDEFVRLRERKKLLASQIEAEVKHGTEFRQKAKSVTSLVTSVLSVPDFRLADDLTVQVRYDRGEDGWFSFDELSPGERAVRAIVTAIRLKACPGKIGVICVNQNDWESLDVAARNAVVAASAEHGVAILTGHSELESRCQDCDSVCSGLHCSQCGGEASSLPAGVRPVVRS